MSKRTARVRMGTFNTGRATTAQIREVCHSADITALQEFSDRDSVAVALRRDGLGLIRPDDHIGQPATPLVFDPERFLLVRPFSVPLAPGGDIGQGTGPDHGKPKFLNGAYFIDRLTRRRIGASCIHTYADEEPGSKRLRLSVDMVEKGVDHFDGYRGIAFIMGDFNSEPGKPTTQPLIRAHWKCNHIEGRELSTHGAHWTPDHIWWHDGRGRIEMNSQRVIRKTRSDHGALIVDFDLAYGPHTKGGVQ